MACAEKRGKGNAAWRVKYKQPTGVEASESGFGTKAAALAWGRDQEAAIRAGTWQHPNVGKITLSQWIDRWLPMQDVGLSTVDHRDHMIRRFIRPSLGDEVLNSLSSEQITIWESRLPAQTGVSPRTARAARLLLGTMLGDAAAAKPPLIPYNPALRPRNRGRRTGRRLEREPQQSWATPLETLLIAERAALLSGRDDDFKLIITIAYTGLRWGETIGLELGYAHPAGIHVEWQLRELRGKFHRLPPKDDSYRTPKWEPKLPVDLPDFLTSLVSQQARTQAPCPCVADHGGSGHYLFLGPDGGHHRRSNYARRVFRPACDGKITDAPSTSPAPSSSTPQNGRASPSPHGQPRHTQTRRANRLAAEASPPSPTTPRSPARSRSGRASPRTACATTTKPGWQKTAFQNPRRTTPRPPGPRHARPLRPRLTKNARRTQASTPSPLGRITPSPSRADSALPSAAVRSSDFARMLARRGDDLPTSSQSGRPPT